MTSTIEHPPAEQARSQDDHNRYRLLYVVTAILAITTVVLAGIIIFGNDDSDTGASMPAEVEQVLEEYREAIDTKDFEAFASLVGPGWRMPEYIGDPEGLNPVRLTHGLDGFEDLLRDDRHYVIEPNSDPIVVGDGPWYVSYAEIWKWHEQKIQWAVSATYVLVERNGEILIDEMYLASQPVLWESS